MWLREPFTARVRWGLCNKIMTLFKKNILIILFSAFIVVSNLFAGSLIPTNPPGTSLVTLSDIYEKIQDNNYATSSRSFAPNLAPAGTFVTLQNIWDKAAEIIDNINPETIIAPTTILGVTGTYDVSNLTPDMVATGTVYGNGLVGTKPLSGTRVYSMSTWDRKYSDGEALPGGIYYPFSSQYGYAHGHGHPLAFDNNGKLYATYYRGYIYSTNQGQTWTLVDMSSKIAQGSQWFSSIAVSPDGQKIWVTDRDSGVYVSRDSGLTFNLADQLTGLNLGGELQVLLSPYNSNHLIVYTSHDTGYGQRAGQIYRSADSGNTWQSLNTAISTAGSVGPSAGTPIAFDPDDINTFYFIEMPYSDPWWSILYVTHDGGSTFSQIPDAMTSYASAVGVANDGNGKRLIISGACVVPTHTAVNNISWAGVGGANDYCGYDSTITVHPLNQNEVYIWNKGGYSLDGGKTVQEPNWPISSPDNISSTAFPDPFQAHTFFVGSYYGKILKSTNGGASWSVVGAMPYSQ